MREPMDKCGQCPDRPLTAESIIKVFTSQAPMAVFEESLQELFVSFVNCNELYKGEQKDNAVYTYTVLRTLIKSVEKLQKTKSDGNN